MDDVVSKKFCFAYMALFEKSGADLAKILNYSVSYMNKVLSKNCHQPSKEFEKRLKEKFEIKDFSDYLTSSDQQQDIIKHLKTSILELQKMLELLESDFSSQSLPKSLEK